MQFHEYGTQKKIPFKLTLNGVGVSVTLVTNDVYVSVDGAAPAAVDVGTIAAVNATTATGLYEWTPTVAQTQAAHYFTLYIKDQTDPVAFDENLITHYTGGNASARFSG